MEKQALAIVHVGIDFELPTRLSQCCADARGKGGLELLLNFALLSRFKRVATASRLPRSKKCAGVNT